MNNVRLLTTVLVALCVGASAQAWHVTGKVVCDDNANGQIDAQDLGEEGVVVTVKNTSGSFTTTGITTSDGSFLIDLPHSPDSYQVSLYAPTVPPGAKVLLPQGGSYAFTLTDTNQYFEQANFLLKCNEAPPPAPGSDCDFVTGGGWILTSSGVKATFAVSGGTKGSDFWGTLNYIDHNTGLHVRSTAVTGYAHDPANANGRVITYDVLIGDTAGAAVVTVVDNGEPGAHDTFAITLSNGYTASGELGGSRPGGGNIQLHTCGRDK